MKIIKLDNRHKLKKKGYEYGIKFKWWYDAKEIEAALTRAYGGPYSAYIHRKVPQWLGQWSHSGKDRSYWIGLRNKEMISYLMLCTNLSHND